MQNGMWTQMVPGRSFPVRAANRTSGSWYEDVRFALPAQPVDATPSIALIRECFPWRTNLFGRARSKPSQGSVAADL